MCRQYYCKFWLCQSEFVHYRFQRTVPHPCIRYTSHHILCIFHWWSVEHCQWNLSRHFGVDKVKPILFTSYYCCRLDTSVCLALLTWQTTSPDSVSGSCTCSINCEPAKPGIFLHIKWSTFPTRFPSTKATSNVPYGLDCDRWIMWCALAICYAPHTGKVDDEAPTVPKARLYACHNIKRGRGCGNFPFLKSDLGSATLWESPQLCVGYLTGSFFCLSHRRVGELVTRLDDSIHFLHNTTIPTLRETECFFFGFFFGWWSQSLPTIYLKAMYLAAKDDNYFLNYLTILPNALVRTSEARKRGKMRLRTPIGSVGLKCC